MPFPLEPVATDGDWLNSFSPINISPHDEDESDDDNEDAADDEADVTPEAFEQSRAVDAKDDSGDSVVKDDDRLAA